MTRNEMAFGVFNRILGVNAVMIPDEKNNDKLMINTELLEEVVKETTKILDNLYIN